MKSIFNCNGKILMALALMLLPLKAFPIFVLDDILAQITKNFTPDMVIYSNNLALESASVKRVAELSAANVTAIASARAMEKEYKDYCNQYNDMIMRNKLSIRDIKSELGKDKTVRALKRIPEYMNLIDLVLDIKDEFQDLAHKTLKTDFGNPQLERQNTIVMVEQFTQLIDVYNTLNNVILSEISSNENSSGNITNRHDIQWWISFGDGTENRLKGIRAKLRMQNSIVSSRDLFDGKYIRNYIRENTDRVINNTKKELEGSGWR